MSALLEGIGVAIILMVMVVSIAYWLVEVNHPGWVKGLTMLAIGCALIYIGRQLP